MKNLEENCNMRTELNQYEPIQTIENTFESANAYNCNLCGELFPCEEDVLLEHIAEHRS